MPDSMLEKYRFISPRSSDQNCEHKGKFDTTWLFSIGSLQVSLLEDCCSEEVVNAFFRFETRLSFILALCMMMESGVRFCMNFGW